MTYSNGGLSIDLGDDGPTQNDNADTDTGPNNLQNFPNIDLAEAGTSTRLTGTLNSTPNSAFTIDFYVDLFSGNTGNTDADRFIGYAMVTTDSDGQPVLRSQ